MTYTIIGHDGKQYGSITEDQLRSWIAERRVRAQTQAQAAGGSGWMPLSEFPEFADLFPSAAPQPVSVPQPKTSGMAITSLVLGTLGFFSCGITALVGLILGIIAMVKVKNSQGHLKGGGLALAGTIVSGIFLLLIPIFVAMLLPAVAAAKQRAEAISCVNNEQQLAMTIRIYSGNHTNQFPPAATWCDAIKDDVESTIPFKCVAANANSRCDYAFNAKLDGMDESKVNPRTVMLFESNAGWNANGGPDLMIKSPRHAQVFVVTYVDGSVHQLHQSQLGTLRWDP